MPALVAVAAVVNGAPAEADARRLLAYLGTPRAQALLGRCFAPQPVASAAATGRGAVRGRGGRLLAARLQPAAEPAQRPERGGRLAERREPRRRLLPRHDEPRTGRLGHGRHGRHAWSTAPGDDVRVYQADLERGGHGLRRRRARRDRSRSSACASRAAPARRASSPTTASSTCGAAASPRRATCASRTARSTRACSGDTCQRRRRHRRGPGPELAGEEDRAARGQAGRQRWPCSTYLLATTDLGGALSPRARRRHRPAGGRGRALHAHPGPLDLALAGAAARPGLRRAAAPPVGVVPGGHLLQQLPAQQHRRRRGARPRQLAAHRLHHHLDRDRRHRPHPRPGRLVPAGPGRLRARRPRLRGLAGAAPALVRAGDRLRGARLRLLPSRHRAPAPGRVAPVLDRVGAPALRDRAGRRARLPRAARRGVDGVRGQRRAAGPRRRLLLRRGAVAAHPAAALRRRSSSCPCAAWCRRCRCRSTAGASARACSSCTSTSWGCRKESALAFSLVGAGLIVLLSLSGAVVWTSRNALAPPAPGE